MCNHCVVTTQKLNLKMMEADFETDVEITESMMHHNSIEYVYINKCDKIMISHE